MKPVKCEDLIAVPMQFMYILVRFAAGAVGLVAYTLCEILSLVNNKILVPLNEFCGRFMDTVDLLVNKLETGAPAND